MNRGLQGTPSAGLACPGAVPFLPGCGNISRQGWRPSEVAQTSLLLLACSLHAVERPRCKPHITTKAKTRKTTGSLNHRSKAPSLKGQHFHISYNYGNATNSLGRVAMYPNYSAGWQCHELNGHSTQLPFLLLQATTNARGTKPAAILALCRIPGRNILYSGAATQCANVPLILPSQDARAAVLSKHQGKVMPGASEHKW